MQSSQEIYMAQGIVSIVTIITSLIIRMHILTEVS